MIKTNAPRTQRSEPDHSVTLKRLTTSVERLKGRVDELEAERDQLLEENRKLRRQMTQLRLLNELEESIDAIKESTGQLPAAPPPADSLYGVLPPSFAFSEFFQIAENRGLDSEEARRCLLHFLAEDRIVQSGSRLTKAQWAIGNEKSETA